MIKMLVAVSVSNYVPWDTSKLASMAAYIKDVIGSSVNVGIIILGIILAVLVVLRLIKKFAK